MRSSVPRRLRSYPTVDAASRPRLFGTRPATPPPVPARLASRPQLRASGPRDARRRRLACACGGPGRTETAYVALGGNLGDRVAEIEKACREMHRRGIRVKRTSNLWETKPMYVVDQDRFINGACEVSLRLPS